MKIVVIGAGAMGGSYGGLLALAGHDVALIDTWSAHVDVINTKGLRVEGVLGDHCVRLPATTSPPNDQTADVAIVFVDSNNTEAAAETARQILSDQGCAITFQNGIGNVETLQGVLGADRVLGGSSMCSAATLGPGHVRLTNMGMTTVGEINGTETPRAGAIVEMLGKAGFEASLSADMMAQIWEKFVLNCGANAIAATTGLRPGEFARVPEINAFQDRVLAEIMAVIAAKGIALPHPNIDARIKDGCWKKFNRPSMLQHVQAGRKTEIGALNVALIREAEAVGVATPNNQALVALLLGRELSQMRAVHEPNIDYEAWEARVAAGQED